MINVTNGPNVHVRLTALEFLLGHSVRSSNQILEIELLPKLLRPFASYPRLLSATLFLDDFFRQSWRQFRIMREVHGKRCAALSAAAQVRGVSEHLRQWNFHANDIDACAIFRALNRRTPRIQVAEHRGHIFFRYHDFDFHDRFEQYWLG